MLEDNFYSKDYKLNARCLHSTESVQSIAGMQVLNMGVGRARGTYGWLLPLAHNEISFLPLFFLIQFLDFLHEFTCSRLRYRRCVWRKRVE